MSSSNIGGIWISLFVFVNLTTVLYLGGLALDTVMGTGDGSILLNSIIGLALFAAALQLSDLAFRELDIDCCPAFCPPADILPVEILLILSLDLEVASFDPKLAKIDEIGLFANFFSFKCSYNLNNDPHKKCLIKNFLIANLNK